MKITNVEAIPFHLPFDPSLHLRFAYRTSTGARHVLVRIFTDEGIVGISEAPARPEIYGETQGSIVNVIDQHLGPCIWGKDPFHLEEIHALLDHIPYNFCAKSSIDIALHDILGKSLQVPLYKLLGGKTRDSVPLSWMVGINPREKMVEECEKFAALGIRAFKIKAGLDFEEDRDTFIAIRKALGDEALLYMDANQGYTSLKKAVFYINQLAEYGLAWMEEPFPVKRRKDRLEASRLLRVPLAGDESCFTPYDVAGELELGAVGIVVVKVARTGFHRTKKILSLCQEAGIPCMVGSQGDSTLGAAASLHVAVAFPNILFPAEVSYHLRMKGDLAEEPLLFRGGSLLLPEKPGLGITLQEEALKKFRL
jgi:L-alanine-DL-glutamate epimerase-like enolase superfamily enzyme